MVTYVIGRRQFNVGCPWRRLVGLKISQIVELRGDMSKSIRHALGLLGRSQCCNHLYAHTVR